MAQAVDKPLDDGRVKLPSVDSAMVKVAPQAKSGGKGSKDDDKPITMRPGDPQEKREEEDEDKILARARKRFDLCIKAESENRKHGLDDLKFYSGEGQWPADVVAQRNFDNRPCVTINKMRTFVKQVTNDQRENRPAINVSPVGDRGDPELAKMFAGLIRFFDRESDADIAYDTGFESAVRIGWGYWRTITEWASHDTFDQTISVKRIRNAFTVYLDPEHQEPDGADARYGFVTDEIPRDDFKAMFPKADPLNWTQGAVGDTFKNWIKQDTIRIAEYFELKHEKRKLVMLSNGFTGWEDELDERAKAAFDVVREREAECPYWMWYKITGIEILEEREWCGSHMPIVKVIGDEVDIEGKLKLAGIIRDAKGAQLMYNYFRTYAVELQALQPKAPYVMVEGQDEGYETEWKNANIKSLPVLHYRQVDGEGKPAPPPQRSVMQPVTQGADLQAQIAAQDMMATTGIRFDATPHERMYDESGRALRELRRSGDIGSFHYIDNLSRSLRRQGKIYVDLIPKVLESRRIVTILREDGSEERVMLDPNAPKAFQEQRMQNNNNKVMKIFNPTIGKYGVTVTIGPSYASKRIEAAESMMQFARALPNAAGLVMDLIAKNQDWPGADEMATRLAKAIPPNLLSPEQKDMPPQVQAMLQAMDQQIKQLMQERLAMMKALNDTQADRTQRQDKIEKDFEAKLLKIISDLETKGKALQQKEGDSLNRHVGSNIQRLADQVGELAGALTEPAGEANA